MSEARVLAADWVVPVDAEPIEHGAVVVADGVIVVEAQLRLARARLQV